MRKLPHSAYDADFTDGQAETAIAIPATALSAEAICTGANVWLAVNSSSASLGLTSSPETKAILLDKDWTEPVCLSLYGGSGRNNDFTHLKFKPVAGAAGHLTVNFFR